MTDDSGRIVAGKYTIVRALGRGGMGEVYLARDGRLQRNVAIKYLRGDLPEGNWQERMQREAQLLAQLNHPNIVQIYDILDEDGVPALVMEYVDGRNLHIHLREHRAELGERLRWLTEISAAIAAFHERGIVHCDLKLENVLLSPAGVSKVTDFGIASDNSDPAADIHALGRVAENLLSDYRDALSPTLRELLADLAGDKRKQPDAATAADRFRLAWYENSQDETPLPADLGEPKAGVGKRPFYLGAAAVLVIALASYFTLRSPPAPLYVAVAPVELTMERGADEREARYLKTAVSQTLRQGVLDSPGLSLVSYEKNDLGDTDYATTLATLEVDKLLNPQLSCDKFTCQLTLERLDGPDGAVGYQYSTTLLIDAILDSSLAVREQWSALFPESGLQITSQPDISKDAYNRYLEIYIAERQSSEPVEQLFSRSEALLAEAPEFAPLYTLYSLLAIAHFEFMGTPESLDNLERVLKSGSREVSDPSLLDRSWFELYRVKEDREAASQVLERILARSPDPALENFLHGQLAVTAREFEQAVPFFDRAVRIQPSSEHYYALARTLFFTGDKDRTLGVLGQMLDRYPNSTMALNLLGVIHVEQWHLEEAAKAWERNLEVQPDPMVRSNLGTVYLMQGYYEQAREQFSIAYDQKSRDGGLVLNLADAEHLLGNEARAKELYQDIVTRYENEDPSIFPEVAAQSLAHLGRYEEALKIVNTQEAELEQHPLVAFSNALVYTLAGQRLAALVEVGEAIDGELAPGFFNLPWFDLLCAEPRFGEILASAGDLDRCTGVESAQLE